MQPLLLLLMTALVGQLDAATEAPTPEVVTGVVQGVDERTNTLIDHIVTKQQAMDAALKLDTTKLGVSEAIGCGKCSLEERLYCMDTVISDHCCCDKDTEPMPFVPHKCKIALPPSPPCFPVAGNCGIYSRIFECCCKHILQKTFPSRPSHSGLLASLFSLIGLPLNEGGPGEDPVPHRPQTLAQSSSQSSSQSFAGFYPPVQGYNGSFSLADDPSTHVTSSAGHNKLVSGAHVARGGLAALLATLPMLLLR
ncbi:Hypothetical predicted protein [Cloeon dipterum]|uniref:CCC domain-containing protein n=1 Tax=Cloeon dipterum TaxID=197152 RepID=A0A8S1C1U2_9INSE|nr:Hypothetical predicted protein [Cloeon dipterum]